MKNNTIKTILLTGIILSLSACGNKQNQPKSEAERNEISVSILPQKYFVEKIAGDLLEVNVMIPPGASPATYEPSPAQLTSLINSDLYLKIGYTGFEIAWMNKLSQANKKMQIIDLSENITLIQEKTTHHHEHEDSHNHEGHVHYKGIDPHIWLSPKNVKLISGNITEALSETYPEHKDYFKKNYASFSQEIDSIDLAIKNNLKNLKSYSFFTYHPSLSYFVRDYNLKQYSMERSGKTPSASHLKEMIDLGKKENIKVIFLQMQFDQHNAKVLAEEIGAKIVQINPLDPDWGKQMVYISEQINEQLQ